MVKFVTLLFFMSSVAWGAKASFSVPEELKKELKHAQRSFPRGKIRMKMNDVVLDQTCRTNTHQCVCESGTASHNFIGPDGKRYRQCMATQCPSGESLVKRPSKNLKQDFVCINNARLRAER